MVIERIIYSLTEIKFQTICYLYEYFDLGEEYYAENLLDYFNKWKCKRQMWGLMQRIVWKCGNYMGGLLWISSPPFIKTLENYGWNVKNMHGTIGSEITYCN